MSAPYAEAKRRADELLAELSPACERIEIAGGVRRQKPECHDTELVAIPKFEPILDIFNQVARQRNLLNERIEELHLVLDKNGDRYKKIIYTEDLDCDLFIVLPPAQWGVIFTIRTGSAEFSHYIVTPRKYGGKMPSDCACKDGAVHDKSGRIIPMPEEMDFLNFLGLGWIKPSDRIGAI
jgi:DNA polymerase/3'-5' exonuclease PolX